MKSLRSKFIALLLGLALAPGLVVVFLTQDLLEQTLAIGLNQKVKDGLDAAVLAIQKRHAQERELLAHELRRAAAFSPLASFQPNDSLNVFMLLNSERRVVQTWPSREHFAPPVFLQSAAHDSLFDAGSDSLALRLAHKMPNGAWLIGQRTIAAELRRQTTLVMQAAQHSIVFDFERANFWRGFVKTFLLLYALVLFLSFIMGWYFSRLITKPLEKLAAAARRLAQGDWQQRVALHSNDEIGEMGRAFNAMVGDLQRQQEQVIALEKMAAWREIARVLAHEIKNPLTPIQLMVQQMQDEYRGENDEYRAMLKKCGAIISEEISKLQKLVREFSDFARMPELHLAPGQVNDLLKEVASLYATRNVKLELDPSLPMFSFDGEALRRVFINLIQNALQSSPTAEVTLATRWLAHEHHIEIIVADTGSGIPPENLRRIFEPYFSTKKSGMGLGLAIVKRIIEEHRGKIAVTSEMGRGTRFIITLAD